MPSSRVYLFMIFKFIMVWSAISLFCCYSCNRKAICYSSRIMLIYIMPPCYKILNNFAGQQNHPTCFSWICMGHDDIWFIQLAHLQFLLYCACRCKRHRIIYHRLIFAIFTFACTWEYRSVLMPKEDINILVWSLTIVDTSLIFKPELKWSVYVILYCNPTILPICLMLSNLKDIFRMLQFYFSSLYFFIWKIISILILFLDFEDGMSLKVTINIDEVNISKNCLFSEQTSNFMSQCYLKYIFHDKGNIHF